MILLCGIPSESPLRLVTERLEASGRPFVLFNQRRARETHLEFTIEDGVIAGRLHVNGRDLPLEDVGGVYARFMDDQRLPELAAEPPESPARAHVRALHDGLMRWSEVAPGRVVNRTLPMASNSSKPYQAQLIRQFGLDVPETLVTDEPELVQEFVARHGTVIYKSTSGARSVVRTLGASDWARIGKIRWCPTQFQAFVDGVNVRVHTIGQRTFATEIVSDATDYRYAVRQVGEAAELRAVELPDDLAERCTGVAAGLGLDFAGIDLKCAPDGRVYCFEVNPCPAYSYYEANTEQPISAALADYLAGAA